ncbi:MAG TPA: nucleoside-diphosphate sugar epimerase/dehydratase [Bacillota bacterium]|nr:nucleoside-diphosphate sugar epimerase/dehydratase [Bacillota bacterium]
MTNRVKILLYMVWDSLAIIAAVWLSSMLHQQKAGEDHVSLVLYPLILILSFSLGNMYRRLWAYAGKGELLAILKWSLVAVAGCALINHLLGSTLNAPVWLDVWFLLVLATGGGRVGWMRWERGDSNPDAERGLKPALIVGAGDGGSIVAAALKKNGVDLRPVAFVDDDPAKVGMNLQGIPVLGTRDDIEAICHKYSIEVIIIAIPSATSSQIRDLVTLCQGLPVRLKIIPGVIKLLSGQLTPDQLRDIQVEDLLKRDTIRLSTTAVADHLRGKRVLVTGAGGSIGAELCRQIAAFGPGKLIILGHGENSIYGLNQQLTRNFPSLEVVPEIVDVRHMSRFRKVFASHKPDVVFHAAAHKHVPLMEASPEEAFTNNVLGTRNAALLAHQHGCGAFVLISSDKAVNAINVMGATKKVAELLVQRMNQLSETVFLAVRFGNVLGSRGSVVPVFQEQISRGGPVTVTHKDMSRYFMTIPEAVQLVLKAGALAAGGEVFVLDMGEPVKIVDLARSMIRLSQSPRKIDIQFTGMRPGEKLDEELFTMEEGLTMVRQEGLFITYPAQGMETIVDQIINLPEALDQINSGEALGWLKRLVPTLKQE